MERIKAIALHPVIELETSVEVNGQTVNIQIESEHTHTILVMDLVALAAAVGFAVWRAVIG